MNVKTIEWNGKAITILDQNKLPHVTEYVELKSEEEVFDAIRSMKVRGAPLIGVTAAWGVVVSVKDKYNDVLDMREKVRQVCDYLSKSRPTAVNLFWALEKMERAALGETIDEIIGNLEEMAMAIQEEDEDTNRAIGENLLAMLKDGNSILTHCNAGWLATTKYGTALAPVYVGLEQGIRLKVFADETRPRLQGSLLTAYELAQAGVDVTVLTDNMSAIVLSQGKVDAVIVGCDRVAANGDTANKTGTLGLSIIAKNYDVPFYVAAPTSTIDLNTTDGSKIPIEIREDSEVSNRFGVVTVPEGAKVFNPSFDVTPWENITAIVTEKGIVKAPFTVGLKKILNR